MQDPVGSPNPDGDLFDLKLNSTGKTYALKFYTMARVSVVFGVLIIVVIIVETTVRLIKLPGKLSSGDGVMNFVDTIYPYYSFAHAILASLLLYYYFLAGKYLKTGINYSNEESFNLAFKALYLSTVFSVIN